MNRELNKYLRQVRRCLPCAAKQKQNILNEISGTISAWLEENPGADLDRICQRFGTPQQIATAYVDELGSTELLRDLQVRKKIIKIVAAGVAVVIAVWVIVMGIALVAELENSDGYYDVYIITTSTLEG